MATRLTLGSVKCKGCIRARRGGAPCASHSRVGGTQAKGTLHDGHPVSPIRYRLWQTMRVLRRFTMSQLAASAEVKIAAARTYVLELTRAGYLRVERPAQARRGRDGEAVRVLARDSGPRPPRVRRDGSVFDPNLDRPNVQRRRGDGGGGKTFTGAVD